MTLARVSPSLGDKLYEKKTVEINKNFILGNAVIIFFLGGSIFGYKFSTSFFENHIEISKTLTPFGCGLCIAFFSVVVGLASLCGLAIFSVYGRRIIKNVGRRKMKHRV